MSLQTEERDLRTMLQELSREMKPADWLKDAVEPINEFVQDKPRAKEFGLQAAFVDDFSSPSLLLKFDGPFGSKTFARFATSRRGGLLLYWKQAHGTDEPITTEAAFNEMVLRLMPAWLTAAEEG